MTYSKILEHEDLNFEQWFAVLLNNDIVGNKGNKTRLALIRRQNARLIERLVARIKQITDDPVIEESCNATQKPQILEISNKYAPQNLTECFYKN
jgi:hypothetical protein